METKKLKVRSEAKSEETKKIFELIVDKICSVFEFILRTYNEDNNFLKLNPSDSLFYKVLYPAYELAFLKASSEMADLCLQLQKSIEKNEDVRTPEINIKLNEYIELKKTCGLTSYLNLEQFNILYESSLPLKVKYMIYLFNSYVAYHYFFRLRDTKYIEELLTMNINAKHKLSLYKIFSSFYTDDEFIIYSDGETLKPKLGKTMHIEY